MCIGYQLSTTSCNLKEGPSGKNALVDPANAFKYSKTCFERHLAFIVLVSIENLGVSLKTGSTGIVVAFLGSDHFVRVKSSWIHQCKYPI